MEKLITERDDMDIHILMLECITEDVEKLSAVLSQARVCFTLRVISTKEELEAEPLEAYDIVISEYMLNNYDGLSAVKHIRERSDIPIVMISKVLDEEMGYTLLEAGADEFIKKSCLRNLPLIMSKVMRNHSFRKQSESANSQVKELSDMLDTLFDSLQNPLFIKDTEGRYQRVNAAYCKLYEHSEAEIIGRTDAELRWMHDEANAAADDQYILERGIPTYREISYFNTQGKKVWLEVTKTPVKARGRITGILGQLKNVTQRKKAVASMEKTLNVLYQTEELTRAGSFEYDADLDMVSCSKNLMMMLGLHASQISLTRLVRLIKKEDQDGFLADISHCVDTRKEYRKRHKYVLGEKKRGYFEILFRPDYRDDEGKTFYGIIVDITNFNGAPGEPVVPERNGHNLNAVNGAMT